MEPTALFYRGLGIDFWCRLLGGERGERESFTLQNVESFSFVAVVVTIAFQLCTPYTVGRPHIQLCISYSMSTVQCVFKFIKGWLFVSNHIFICTCQFERQGQLPFSVCLRKNANTRRKTKTISLEGRCYLTCNSRLANMANVIIFPRLVRIKPPDSGK